MSPPPEYITIYVCPSCGMTKTPDERPDPYSKGLVDRVSRRTCHNYAAHGKARGMEPVSYRREFSA